MDRRRNMLIGIAVSVLVVAASIYATGLTKRLLSPLRGNVAEYKSSESNAAPELAAGDWINSEPLKLADLRGRVVLIEFWTFGCYNCRNTLPYVKGWHARYRAKGLAVISVHSPEFDEERKIEHLRREVIARLDDSKLEDGSDLFDYAWLRPLADRLLELAKHNHARLVSAP